MMKYIAVGLFVLGVALVLWGDYHFEASSGESKYAGANLVLAGSAILVVELVAVALFGLWKLFS